MKRRNFITRSLIGSAAVIVAPIVLVSTETELIKEPSIEDNTNPCKWNPKGNEFKYQRNDNHPVVEYKDENKEIGEIWDLCWGKLLNK